MTDDDIAYRAPLDFAAGARPLTELVAHQSLDALSAEELQRGIVLLKAEITRFETALAAKYNHRAEADALFSFKS